MTAHHAPGGASLAAGARMPGSTAPLVLVNEGLGNASYLVQLEDRRALVIDPERDPSRYLAAAEARGLSIAYTAETHLHADFVSGSRELAAYGAQVLAPRPVQAWTRAFHTRLYRRTQPPQLVRSPGALARQVRWRTGDEAARRLHAAANPRLTLGRREGVGGQIGRLDILMISKYASMHADHDPHQIFQASTIATLLDGALEGDGE